MTEAEKIWAEKVKAVCVERGWLMDPKKPSRLTHSTVEAACRLIEEFEAFRQEVSDAVDAFNNRIGSNGIQGLRQQDWESLTRFVIPKPEPDPLVEVFDEIHGYQLKEGETWSQSIADRFRKSLAKRGLKIIEVDDE